jgi:hypothetical protein
LTKSKSPKTNKDGRARKMEILESQTGGQKDLKVAERRMGMGMGMGMGLEDMSGGKWRTR